MPDTAANRAHSSDTTRRCSSRPRPAAARSAASNSGYTLLGMAAWWTASSSRPSGPVVAHQRGGLAGGKWPVELADRLGRRPFFRLWTFSTPTIRATSSRPAAISAPRSLRRYCGRLPPIRLCTVRTPREPQPLGHQPARIGVAERDAHQRGDDLHPLQQPPAGVGSGPPGGLHRHDPAIRAGLARKRRAGRSRRTRRRPGSERSVMAGEYRRSSGARSPLSHRARVARASFTRSTVASIRGRSHSPGANFVTRSASSRTASQWWRTPAAAPVLRRPLHLFQDQRPVVGLAPAGARASAGPGGPAPGSGTPSR